MSRAPALLVWLACLRIVVVAAPAAPARPSGRPRRRARSGRSPPSRTRPRPRGRAGLAERDGGRGRDVGPPRGSSRAATRARSASMPFLLGDVVLLPGRSRRSRKVGARRLEHARRPGHGRILGAALGATAGRSRRAARRRCATALVRPGAGRPTRALDRRPRHLGRGEGRAEVDECATRASAR